MRSVLVALVVLSALLAGCTGDGGKDDPNTYACPDGTEIDLDGIPGSENSTFNPLSKCPKSSGSSSSNSTPNVLPTLSLTVTDDAGNETVVGTLMGNLTFSAEGSTDADGSITGIAVSVTDSNTTRTASLFDPVAKAFKPATFKFDRPGVVNVTVAMVDDRAGFTVNQSKVYINHPQNLAPVNIQLGGGGVAVDSACGGNDDVGPVRGDLYEAQYYKEYSFALLEGATFVEATSNAGDITICSPHVEGAYDSTPLSETGSRATVTNPGVALPAPVGTQSYYVSATLPSGGGQDVGVTVVVHYEPQEAAAA